MGKVVFFIMKKIIQIVVMGLLLSGCASNYKTINANSQLTVDSTNFMVPKNTSRIYFLTGSCDAPLKKWDCPGAGVCDSMRVARLLLAILHCQILFLSLWSFRCSLRSETGSSPLLSFAPFCSLHLLRST